MCPKCNIEYEEDKKFCKKCGSPLVEKRLEAKVKIPSIPKKRAPLGPLIGIFLGILLGIFAGVYVIPNFIFKIKTEKPKEKTESRYVPPEEPEKMQEPILIQEIKETIYHWKEAWERLDLDKYMSYYSPNFYAEYKKMDYYAWREYKRGLFNKYSWCRIDIGHIYITSIDSNRVKATFYQKFEADSYRDKGTKILEFIKTPYGWKIISEDFKEEY
jgi:murein L,D-transpeptidase YafK